MNTPTPQPNVTEAHKKPCPTCQGRGELRAHTGWEPCLDCNQTGLAPLPAPVPPSTGKTDLEALAREAEQNLRLAQEAERHNHQFFLAVMDAAGMKGEVGPLHSLQRKALQILSPLLATTKQQAARIGEADKLRKDLLAATGVADEGQSLDADFVAWVKLHFDRCFQYGRERDEAVKLAADRLLGYNDLHAQFVKETSRTSALQQDRDGARELLREAHSFVKVHPDSGNLSDRITAHLTPTTPPADGAKEGEKV